MSMSNYLENKLLDHVFNTTSYTPPTIYVGLSKKDPLDDGSELDEPSGNGYARTRTSAGDWAAAAGGQKLNVNSIVFPVATGSWGTVTHVCLFDSLVGDNLLWSGSLYEPVEIMLGLLPRFAAGQLIASMN